MTLLGPGCPASVSHLYSPPLAGGCGPTHLSLLYFSKLSFPLGSPGSGFSTPKFLKPICSNSHPLRTPPHTPHPHLHPLPPLLGSQSSLCSSIMMEVFLARLWRLVGGADQPARGGPWAVHVAALAHGDAFHLAPKPIRPHLRGCPSRGGPVRLEMPSEMEMWSICL